MIFSFQFYSIKSIIYDSQTAITFKTYKVFFFIFIALIRRELAMKNNIADRMQDITPFYVMELLQRAKQLELQGMDVVHMEVGEPDFMTPEPIRLAGIKHIKSGHTKYTPAAGLPQLREKIAAYYHTKYGVTVDKRRIFVTPGASGAFVLALGTSLNPGEDILLGDPCYPCNNNFIRLFSGKTRLIPVNVESSYQLTAELIDQHWGVKTKGAIIASPSNPTGTIIAPQLLQEAVAAVNRKGGCFFSDEIYHGLVYDAKETTALAFSDQVFVINSFSKFFGMTGWRVGWLIVPEIFIEAVEKLAQNIYISTPTHSQYAALSAFEHDTLRELEYRRLEFLRRRDFLFENLQQLGFKVAIKPQGAFYIYADCSQFSNDSYEFSKQLLEAEGVAITPGKDFGVNAANHHVRFAYTTSIERLQMGVSRIKNFINKK